MNKHVLIIVAVVSILLIVVGSVVILELAGPSPTVVLDVRGEPGVRVVGEAVVDGARQRLDGTLPVKFTLQGKRVAFRILGADDKKATVLQARVLVNGIDEMSASASPGVAGELYRPVVLPGRWWTISSFQAPGEDAAQFRARLLAE